MRQKKITALLLISVAALTQLAGCAPQPAKPNSGPRSQLTEMEKIEILARKSGHLKLNDFIEKTFKKGAFAARNPGRECPYYFLYEEGSQQKEINWHSNTQEKGWSFSSGQNIKSTSKNGNDDLNNTLFNDSIHRFGRESYLQLVQDSFYSGRKGGSGKRVLVVDIDSPRPAEFEQELAKSGLDFNLIPVGRTPEGQAIAKSIACAENPQKSWQAFKNGKKDLESPDCPYNPKNAYDAQCMLGGAPILVRSDGKSATTLADMVAISKDQELPDVQVEEYKMGASRRLVEQSLPRETCKSMGEWVKCEARDIKKGVHSDEWYEKYCKNNTSCLKQIEEGYGFRLIRKVYYGGTEAKQANFAFSNNRLALVAVVLRDIESAKIYLTRTAGAPKIVTNYQVENRSIHTVRPIMIGGVASVEHDFYPTQQVTTTKIFQWNAKGYYAEMEGNILKIALVDAR